MSVLCITYKHEKYIAQAIESMLMQQTDFAVEMVIGEDCSPDATRQIAQDYERRYPSRVRVLAHEHNLGIMPNLMTTIAACRGEFIAFLEGDDYWNDPTKLQRQVDALRASADCAMCFHDAVIVSEDGIQDPSVAPGENTICYSELFQGIIPRPGPEVAPVRFSQLDLARLGWFMPSASMLFRASSLPQPLPDWLTGVFSGDYTLQLLSTTHGAALYLPRQMATYRQHAGGVMQTQLNTLTQNARRIWEIEHYRQAFGPEIRKHFEQKLEAYYFERSEKFSAAGDRGRQLYYYGKAIGVSPRRTLHHINRIFRRLIGRPITES